MKLDKSLLERPVISLRSIILHVALRVAAIGISIPLLIRETVKSALSASQRYDEKTLLLFFVTIITPLLWMGYLVVEAVILHLRRKHVLGYCNLAMVILALVLSTVINEIRNP